MYRINKTGKGLRQDETADMDELKDIYGSKIMNRVKKVHESKDIPGFIDIHCHVLPMVDDGAQSTEMALDMLRIAADEGIWKMILTPHQKADRLSLIHI